MAKINIKLKVPPQQEIVGGVLDVIAKKLNAALAKRVTKIRDAVALVVHDAILTSPETSSLLSGELRHQLGVEDATDTVQEIAKAVSAGLNVVNLGIRRHGNALEGGLRIEIVKSDLSEILEAPGGTFISENAKGERHEVPWVKWLTTGGDALLVTDYHFAAGHAEYSRTGDGLMVPTGTWRVPPQFSGTQDDNWITRAIILSIERIQEVVGKEIISGLQ